MLTKIIGHEIIKTEYIKGVQIADMLKVAITFRSNTFTDGANKAWSCLHRVSYLPSTKSALERFLRLATNLFKEYGKKEEAIAERIEEYVSKVITDVGNNHFNEDLKKMVNIIKMFPSTSDSPSLLERFDDYRKFLKKTSIEADVLVKVDIENSINLIKNVAEKIKDTTTSLDAVMYNAQFLKPFSFIFLDVATERDLQTFNDRIAELLNSPHIKDDGERRKIVIKCANILMYLSACFNNAEVKAAARSFFEDTNNTLYKKDKVLDIFDIF